MMKENSIQFASLSHLAANQLTECEKQIYEMLVLMMQKIDWMQLIQIRNQVFLERNEVPLGEVAGPYSRKKRPCVPRDKEESASEDSKSDAFESSEDDYYSGRKKSTERVPEEKHEGSVLSKKRSYNKSKVQKEEEKNEDVDSPKVIKRVCEKLDNALACLKDDLDAYYQWEREELKKDDNLGNLSCAKVVHKYTGKVWIYRGMLAERLLNVKMAEKAYRRVISKGFSLLVWTRLLEFYVIANNLRASVACIAEVLDYFTDELGITEYPRGLPAWMQEALFKLVAKNGEQLVEAAVEQESCGQAAAIRRALESARARRVCGDESVKGCFACGLVELSWLVFE
eukprot:TRINITY_DN16545_c0_g1_i2.p2 TRINITY_DN16545_c0_g1~~TRINITY_DN16545_c0_g1_i2.p2  ORF type:complete len:342 (+),score=101.72 TRINITY_DN16545_c0_g1_i2:1397-2422(+)